MPEKQPFDHRRHLLNEEKAEETASGRPTNRGSTSTTNDDEALARILQEEILEEERRREQSSHGRSSYSNTPSTNYGSSRPGGPKPPPQQDPSNDMELLMRLQQQEAAARSVYNAPSNYSPRAAPKPPPPPDTSNDMELLMRLQREEMDNLRSNRGVDDMELARRMQHEEALGQMQSDYQDQLNYARRIQEKALNANANRQNHSYGSSVPGAHNSYDTPTGYGRSTSRGRGSSSAVGAHNSFGNPTAYGRSTSGGSGSSTPRGAPAHNRAATTSGYPVRHEGGSSGSGTPRGSSAHDSDLELARRMQELEERGMGRMNSDRELSNQRSQPATTSRPQPTTLSQQEEEDARLARMLSESGQSLRNLHVTATPAPAPGAPPPMPKPTPIAAAPVPKPAPKIQKAVPVPQVAIPVPPQNASPTTSSMAKNMRRKTSRSPKRERGVAAIPQSQNAPGEVTPTSNRKKNNFGSLFNRNKDKDKGGEAPISSPKPKKPPAIPAPIPPRPEQRNGPLPYSSMGSRDVNVPTAAGVQQKKKMLPPIRKQPSVCAACQKPTTSFLIALDKKYHAECFKCAGCYQVIDSTQPFAYMTDESGTKHPLHRKCYAELYGVKCAVCKQSIPAGPDGKVSFVKHPFFDKEQMCPRHAQNPGRRCTGCHRFEPHGEPFADLNDAGRCVCYSCCRSVVVDSADAQPLWGGVVEFFENKLHLPIWKDMRKVPILCVGYEALNDQMIATGATHGGSSQIMTRGLCLTEHQSGRKMKLAKLKFNKNNFSFEACDVESKGFTFFQVPDASKVNPDASVTAIICLSGLPRDLSASVLAHEATHAWIKLHPQFDISYPIPPQVEEGCAQLVAMLFLTEGLMPASTETFGDTGPSDAKLRQYFKFSIETDDHEIYGEGYRKAAAAYANIGIEALLSHVVLYKDFPKT